MTPAECAELFAKTLEELNAVSQLQMQGILNVVVAGLEAIKSSSQSDPGTIENFTKLIDDLKAKIEEVGQNSKDLDAPPAESDNFCAEVEANINIAMKNSLNNQQQLNIVGVAALTQILNLLINKTSQN
jgi:hypothetical protein